MFHYFSENSLLVICKYSLLTNLCYIFYITDIIAGITTSIILVVIVIVLIFLAVYFYRRFQRNKVKKPDEASDIEHTDDYMPINPTDIGTLAGATFRTNYRAMSK